MIIPPGSKPFAGVDVPAAPQKDYFHLYDVDADEVVEFAEIASELPVLGGMLWGWCNGYSGALSDQTGFIADQVIADAGTDAFTPGDGALGDSVFGFTFLLSGEERAGSGGAFPTGATNVRGNDLALPADMVLWSFTKHPRVLDVVRWTGDGGASRSIAHSLDRAPGMIMVKRIDGVGDWAVYHNHMTSTPEDVYMVLGTNAASVNDATFWNDTAPTADEFFVGSSLNGNTSEYIAFIFADDDRANGMILTGGYTGTGSGGVPLQSTGWRPDWILVKEVTGTGNWRVYDSARNVGTSTWTTGSVIDDDSSPDVTTTHVVVSGAGWQTDSSGAGDEGMNDTGEDYIWVSVRVDEAE